jgi:cysteine-rich repeat protein
VIRSCVRERDRIVVRLVMANSWLLTGRLLLASSALACGRTDLSSRQPVADAGLVPDIMPPSSPDLARVPSPDSATLPGPDLPQPPGPDLAAPPNPDHAPDLPSPTCGNGQCDPGEECDDGNTLGGDGCDPYCQSEVEWPTCPNVYPVVCADRVLGPGEECDDGNLEDGDGCSAGCKIEPGFRCPVPGRRCAPICGDGLIVGTETCDDGNSTSGDGCSDICLTEICWNCAYPDGVCRVEPPTVDVVTCTYLPDTNDKYCGDGVLEGAEECDEGTQNSDRSYGGCSTHCHYLFCGDGIVSEPEECDQGQAANTAVYGDPGGCTAACTLPPYCGDGHVDANDDEACDLGARNGPGSDCTLSCQIWRP